MPIIFRASQQCCEADIYFPKWQIRKLRLGKFNCLKNTMMGNNRIQAFIGIGLSEFFYCIV